MATIETTWGSDTCGCRIAFRWNDRLPSESRVHTWSKTIRTCPEHAGLSGAALFTQCLEENNNRMHALSRAQDIRPALTLRDMTWSFDASRVLEFSFPLSGLTSQEKLDIQAALDIQLGPGKVRLL